MSLAWVAMHELNDAARLSRATALASSAASSAVPGAGRPNENGREAHSPAAVAQPLGDDEAAPAAAGALMARWGRERSVALHRATARQLRTALGADRAGRAAALRADGAA